MADAGFMQVCLLLGVFVPLASFVFLAFFGTRLPGKGAPAALGHDDHGGGHDDHGHDAGAAGEHSASGHDDHGFPLKVRRTPGGNPAAGWIATLAIAFSLLMATLVLLGWQSADEATRAALTRQSAADAVVWVELGPVPIKFGVRLDSLTLIMFFMVSLCSTCIHIFSIGYMKSDSRFARFFAYLSLFCFSMLGLVIAQSILFIFIFWELVGLCSYFLIGFWFEKESASNAGMKAFITNRVGDFGFLIGMMLCFTYLGTLSLDQASATFEAAAHHAHVAPPATMSEAAQRIDEQTAARAATLFSTSFWGLSLATWMGIGLFCGAIGKSAQVPLQVWLPDAMEGPTPVSALIHAATMVAAGVYLVGRIFTLLTPDAQMFIAIIGCITLTMAALIAMVQVDIKRVLAYSTLSQLGYMVFALGVGAWIAALFHLLTHAFFKAMLFLGSGQVIEGCHHEQDMRKMGGLWTKMPGTAATFLIAVLAISGAGIPYLGLGIGGYYSKDEILAVAYYRHHNWSTTEDAGDASHADARAVSDGPHVVLASHTPQDREQETRAAQTTGQAPHAADGRADGEHGTNYAALYPNAKRLPWILYFLPMAVAYITPFYMGRCFIMTFLGKPRDAHIHEHAHETKLMVYPLYILAIMTLISGPFLFRDLVAGSAPRNSALAPMLDGGHNTAVAHAAHAPLSVIVGFAFVIGLGLAWMVYRNGLQTAERIRNLPFVRPIYHLLWNKFYFDEVYGLILVGGTKLVAIICGLFDNWIIDGIVNSTARITTWFGWFVGWILDARGVDGAVNGTGWLAWNLGGALRRAQTGIIRNYILIAGIVVSGVIISLLSPALVGLSVGFVLLGVCVVAAPAFCKNVFAPLLIAALLIRVGRIVWGGFGAAGDAGAPGWSELGSFFSTYVSHAAGALEVLALLVLFVVLYVRFINAPPSEAEPVVV